jgi:type II secretory pathway pseudopilin PulG
MWVILQWLELASDLLEALDHDAEQLDAKAQAQQAAQSSLDLARASYREGNAGVLLVLGAERSYQQAPRVRQSRGPTLPRYRTAIPGTGRHESERIARGRHSPGATWPRSRAATEGPPECFLKSGLKLCPTNATKEPAR